MGLDITAYENLKEIDCVFNADGEPINPENGLELDSYFRPYFNRDFIVRAEGLKERSVYLYDRATGFGAGSYGVYNNWREGLAKLAVYGELHNDKGRPYSEGAWSATEGPFWELILFSDCEGVIGPVVSAKLLKDFDSFREKAQSLHDEYWFDLYKEWHEAFKLAANNGAVDFH